MAATNTRALVIWILCGVFVPPAVAFGLAFVEPTLAFIVYCLMVFACAIGFAVATGQSPGMRVALSLGMVVGLVVAQAAIIFVGCCAIVGLNNR